MFVMKNTLFAAAVVSTIIGSTSLALADDATSSATNIVGFFAEKGILGIVIIILLVVVRTLYNELRAERNARLEDVKLYRDSVIGATEKVHAAVSELARVADYLERKH